MWRRAVALIVLGGLLTGCGSFMEDEGSPEFEKAARPFQLLTASANIRLGLASRGNHPKPSLYWREVEAVAVVLAIRAEESQSSTSGPNQAPGPIQVTIQVPVDPNRPDLAPDPEVDDQELEDYHKTGLKLVRPYLAKPGYFYNRQTQETCTETQKKRVCTTDVWFIQNTLESVMDKLGFHDEEKEYARGLLLAACTGTSESRRTPSGWMWPLAIYDKHPTEASYSIVSPFGKRQNPVTGVGEQQHDGIDIAVPSCTPVFAAHAGTATLVSQLGDSGCGVEVKIELSNPPEAPGYQSIGSRYCHLLLADVKPGDPVAAGQLIALSGNTGTFTTGAHLHFETHVNGKAVNPMGFYNIAVPAEGH